MPGRPSDTLPDFIDPELATLVERAPEGNAWLHEIKLDGYRTAARIEGRQIRLLTNNPKKVVGLDGYGLHIVERVPIQIEPHEENRRYLQTKKDKLGHLLDQME